MMRPQRSTTSSAKQAPGAALIQELDPNGRGSKSEVALLEIDGAKNVYVQKGSIFFKATAKEAKQRVAQLERKEEERAAAEALSRN
ncbi:unnamed protein product [Amoebophrya sp. A25]|nr:unnamed protein product [Amoebophrya sp. A25]|eukprot:GSA25T00012500001.1